ncbi:hypothetical protein [Brevibacillus laterosporus]|uniref:Uncharacterized protein n=1 Tax=Brevibacillus laterosporus TaxID=1465 RepID=A0AAP3DLE0_BRELA|nr:hypothetical protein [Brevibacillus laterosporus]MCR8983062.1 hypothetical protein [Brevibacillus laterosporus]MCZ0810218.1 hypothetical protein [Brevibacillus laterosporus]MCZ0828876.1 hypothetical protein [Brevibacillus laterosporus]MCZ0852926.1 hypothetical protein [Brevibacillus laterosporus]
MEILSTASNGGALFGFICLGLLTILFMGLASLCILDGEGVGLALIVMSVNCLFGTYHAAVDYATPRYEVTITDMSRFDTDKYQIIEQRGKVFVVKEIRR